MDPAEIRDTRRYEVYKWGKKDFAGTAGALNEVCWGGAGELLWDCWAYMDMGSGGLSKLEVEVKSWNETWSASGCS